MKSKIGFLTGLIALACLVFSCTEELTPHDSAATLPAKEEFFEAKKEPCPDDQDLPFGCGCEIRIDEAPDDVRWWLSTPNNVCCYGDYTGDASVFFYNNCVGFDTAPTIGDWVPFNCDVQPGNVQFSFDAFKAGDCEEWVICPYPETTIRFSVRCLGGDDPIGDENLVEVELTANTVDVMDPFCSKKTAIGSISLSSNCGL